MSHLPLVKNITLGLVKNTTLRLVKKTFLVILDLLKSTCLKKPKWFFDPLSFWGIFCLKIQFEKFGILVVTPKSKTWTQIEAKEFLEKIKKS
jgi:hypothetical protein